MVRTKNTSKIIKTRGYSSVDVKINIKFEEKNEKNVVHFHEEFFCLKSQKFY